MCEKNDVKDLSSQIIENEKQVVAEGKNINPMKAVEVSPLPTKMEFSQKKDDKSSEENGKKDD